MKFLSSLLLFLFVSQQTSLDVAVLCNIFKSLFLTVDVRGPDRGLRIPAG